MYLFFNCTGFMAYLPDEVPLFSHPHRADSIWEDPDEAHTVVKCRRRDSGLWERPLDHRVLQCLLRAGFYGVYRIGHIRLDHPLITALVERWRTETHTFHFPTGQATVTLQDVSVLYGLRIDGRAVTGPDPPLTRDQWIALCAELLGVAPTPADLQAGRVRVRWLSEQFQGHLPDHAPDELVQQYARAYILWLIGGVLLFDKSQNLLKLMYLPLFRDIDVIGQYSWGAVALACLYRMLCRAAQIWAWERLIRIAPSRRQLVTPGEVPIGQGDMQLLPGPRGSRWRVDMGHEVVSTHVVVVYRDQLDRMIEDEVVRAGRSYHLAEDTLFRRDGQDAMQALAEIRELLYEGIQHAHRVDRLHFGHYGVHSVAAAPDTSVPSTSVPSTSAPNTAGLSTSVTPPHYTPYISPYFPHVHPTQHADLDWTPPRYMHDVVTPPTQLPPAFLGTTSTAPMSTHDAVLTDISCVEDEAHIEPPQSARERPRLWSWRTSRPRSGCGQRQRSRSDCRS
ncbi:serine/threonine-protein phosphatase 7 long form homolog [Camellia sinensis]|uniref:serine/threonine-protein phosphatase 7 long form homolog n=1 Tax=Camellia sinensis TaxID=4442 RepID=UPI0010361995|nr:serine/threonine-protein phosphatase 7 long form homolog [Camellia sinensis]